MLFFSRSGSRSEHCGVVLYIHIIVHIISIQYHLIFVYSISTGGFIGRYSSQSLIFMMGKSCRQDTHLFESFRKNTEQT